MLFITECQINVLNLYMSKWITILTLMMYHLNIKSLLSKHLSITTILFRRRYYIVKDITEGSFMWNFLCTFYSSNLVYGLQVRWEASMHTQYALIYDLCRNKDTRFIICFTVNQKKINETKISMLHCSEKSILHYRTGTINTVQDRYNKYSTGQVQ